MTRAPLSDRQLRAAIAAGADVDLTDPGSRGLVFRLRAGRPYFCFRYQYRQKPRRLDLGDFPALTLATARDTVRTHRIALRQGKDPALVAAGAKVAPPVADTVRGLAVDYMRRHARVFKKKSADSDQRWIDVDILPQLGDRKVADLTRHEIRALIDAIADRAPAAGIAVLKLIRKMLNFAVDHDYIQANPAARITKPAPEVARDRVLTHDELRRLVRCLERQPTTAEKPAPRRPRARGTADDPICPLSPALADATKLRLILGQRRSEIIRMKWDDLDLRADVWTIPKEDTKNGEPHRVPLPPLARAIIATYDHDREKFVFGGTGADPLITDRAKKASADLADATGIAFQGRDLRRTAATGMAEAGVPGIYIAYVLNHVDGRPRATHVYDRYTYDREKRIALEAWDRRLTAILANDDAALTGGTVAPFAARA